MVDGVVDATVAVVDTAGLLHVYRSVLCIVLRNVERQLMFDILDVDSGSHLKLTLVEQRQHGVIDIVIKENDALFPLNE